jgi:hypothetical protein
MTFDPAHCSTFRYVGFEIEAPSGELACTYALDELVFTERITVPGEYDWDAPAALEAARIVFLLAGVSYYKAGAPLVIDLGATPVRTGDREFLRAFYLEGLGEFAYRNGLHLDGLRVVGGAPAGAPAACAPSSDRPLIPFGGGIDSIVTVESVRAAFADSTLFVLSRTGDRFAAIERAAAVAALPVARAERALDPAILESTARGYYNGHVPVTGVLSAIAILAAVLGGHGAVVMSNEWSASIGNVDTGDRIVNHQYSKSLAFERELRALLERSFTSPPEYFSLLRPYSEVWVARRFAALERYHRVFRSCNRAFHIDPAARLDHWCGHCDKCCFIDLILAPFLPASELAAVFDGREPLDDPGLSERFRTLVGQSEDLKPFECVGDVGECRAAVRLAAARPDRRNTPVLRQLLAGLPEEERGAAVDGLLAPMGPSFVPERYAPRDLLV